MTTACAILERAELLICSDRDPLLCRLSKTLRRCLLSVLTLLPLAALAAPAPSVLSPANGLQPEQLGIVINDADPLSVEIGNYYQRKRKIPAANVVHVRFKPQQTEIQPGEFAVQKRLLDERLPAQVQALALTWAAPYRVGCMSVTAAFTFGYDIRYCAQGCVFTATSDYADSSSAQPFTDLHIRPTMAIAAKDITSARALIDRGVASDHTLPGGGAYLVQTSDKARSVRKVFFPDVQRSFGDVLPINVVNAESIKNVPNVMFYFTGLKEIPDLDTNRFQPGAVADHLTSAGGMLTDSYQMSALRWLEAGATGSYGTVVEPCAFTQKFPNPELLLKHYLAGETLIEAYWKSVVMPGQGIFIGEPLARPYAAYRVEQYSGRWYVGGPALQPGGYEVFAADAADGPFERVASNLQVNPLTRSLELPPPVKAYYRIQRVAGQATGFTPWLR